MKSLKQIPDNETMKIPGLSFSFKRAVGITKIKQQISRKTGIPMSSSGIARKIGDQLIKCLFDIK